MNQQELAKYIESGKEILQTLRKRIPIDEYFKKKRGSYDTKIKEKEIDRC